MCNLYSLMKGPSAILEFTRALRSEVGNLESLPGVFPDMAAPIVRIVADGIRERVRAHWGMPTPPSFVKDETDSGVTNIHPRPWEPSFGT